MLRALTFVAAAAALLCAVALYTVNYETRKLEAHVQSQERLAERLENDIVVLKAERAFLARPERIEREARKLGLDAARGQQYVLMPPEAGIPSAASRP